MNYVVEDTLRKAKDLPPKYYMLGGVLLILFLVFVYVMWPTSIKKNAETEAALQKIQSEPGANEPAPAVTPTNTDGQPRRRAIQIK